VSSFEPLAKKMQHQEQNSAFDSSAKKMQHQEQSSLDLSNVH
jgi:hypothetical protein